MKKILVVCMALIMLVSVVMFGAGACEVNGPNDVDGCQCEIPYGYTFLGTLSVVLENKISIYFALNQKEFSVDYFSEFQLSDVMFVNINSAERIRRYLVYQDYYPHRIPPNVDNFRISLRLFLYEPCFAIASKYVEILNAREDVWGVSKEFSMPPPPIW
ncbi:MAG: hypothetical protein FWE03_07505 [Firmicutes bacterium]|nr:hypothetical protein [Bacillota bacterium]